MPSASKQAASDLQTQAGCSSVAERLLGTQEVLKVPRDRCFVAGKKTETKAASVL